MRAAIFNEFGGPISIQDVPAPVAKPHGAVIEVKATGLCRSDWHGWMGHDPDIALPHVPGHELAGVIKSVGAGVKKFKPGDRVTVPFVCGCGTCRECKSGNQQVCDFQSQPGFTHWGSFAEYVAIDYADTNLVLIPNSITDIAAASLGCRFTTAFRALIHQGAVKEGQFVAIHGCGGVGLSALMIAKAIGARVIAIDIDEPSLNLARDLGAENIINAHSETDVVERVMDLTDGGVHVSMDALGSRRTCYNSIQNLRKRGRHIQVGLLAGKDKTPPVPMELVVAKELEIIGSHGMQAHKYPEMLAMISKGQLQPEKLIEKTISLNDLCSELPAMDQFKNKGILVVNSF